MSSARHRAQKHQNRTPFVAKRDIKRTETDRANEERLKSLACANVCHRCVAKARWRFQMGKYKAKKNGQRGEVRVVCVEDDLVGVSIAV